MFGHQLETFINDGYNNFIPNMIPPVDVIRDAQRSILETLYHEPARRMGRDIWGFKEVLYKADIAVRLRELYPNMRVLYITRHPFNCFVSLLHEERLKPYEVNIPLHESWSRPKTIEWIKNWTDINESFLEHPQITDNWVFQLTFEQLVSNPAETTGQITEWLGMKHEEFDLDVFNHRRYTDRNNGVTNKQDQRPKLTWEDLSAEECLLITQPKMRLIAAQLGYDLPELFEDKRILEHETII
jgi:hypothetical protein